MTNLIDANSNLNNANALLAPGIPLQGQDLFNALGAVIHAIPLDNDDKAHFWRQVSGVAGLSVGSFMETILTAFVAIDHVDALLRFHPYFRQQMKRVSNYLWRETAIRAPQGIAPGLSEYIALRHALRGIGGLFGSLLEHRPSSEVYPFPDGYDAITGEPAGASPSAPLPANYIRAIEQKRLAFETQQLIVSHGDSALGFLFNLVAYGLGEGIFGAINISSSSDSFIQHHQTTPGSFPAGFGLEVAFFLWKANKKHDGVNLFQLKRVGVDQHIPWGWEGFKTGIVDEAMEIARSEIVQSGIRRDVVLPSTRTDEKLRNHAHALVTLILSNTLALIYYGVVDKYLEAQFGPTPTTAQRFTNKFVRVLPFALTNIASLSRKIQGRRNVTANLYFGAGTLAELKHLFLTATFIKPIPDHIARGLFGGQIGKNSTVVNKLVNGPIAFPFRVLEWGISIAVSAGARLPMQAVLDIACLFESNIFQGIAKNQAQRVIRGRHAFPKMEDIFSFINDKLKKQSIELSSTAIEWKPVANDKLLDKTHKRLTSSTNAFERELSKTIDLLIYEMHLCVDRKEALEKTNDNQNVITKLKILDRSYNESFRKLSTYLKVKNEFEERLLFETGHQEKLLALLNDIDMYTEKLQIHNHENIEAIENARHFLGNVGELQAQEHIQETRDKTDQEIYVDAVEDSGYEMHIDAETGDIETFVDAREELSTAPSIRQPIKIRSIDEVIIESEISRHFSNREDFVEFLRAHRNLHEQLSDEERLRHIELLKIFGRDGKFPFLSIPGTDISLEKVFQSNLQTLLPTHTYAGLIDKYPSLNRKDAIDKLLTPTFISQDSEFLKFGHLVVQREVSAHFVEGFKQLAERNEQLACILLEALRNEGKSSHGLNNDSAEIWIVKGQPFGGSFSSFKPKDNRHQIDWDTDSIVVDPKSDTKATPLIVLVHEIIHMLAQQHNALDQEIRRLTPDIHYTNAEEEVDMRIEKMVAELMGLKARENHHGDSCYLSAFGVHSTEVGLHKGDNRKVATSQKDYDTTGHIIGIQEHPHYVVTLRRNDGRKINTFDLRQLQSLIAINQHCHPEEALERLKDALKHKDVITIARNEHGLPVYINHEQELRFSQSLSQSVVSKASNLIEGMANIAAGIIGNNLSECVTGGVDVVIRPSSIKAVYREHSGALPIPSQEDQKLLESILGKIDKRRSFQYEIVKPVSDELTATFVSLSANGKTGYFLTKGGGDIAKLIQITVPKEQNALLKPGREYELNNLIPKNQQAQTPNIKHKQNNLANKKKNAGPKIP